MTTNRTRIAAVAIAAAAMAGVFDAPASAAPTNPQIPNPQVPGNSAPSNPQLPVVAPEPEPEYWIAPPSQYQNLDYQPIPNYDYDTNRYNTPAPSEQVQFQDLHLPTAVTPSNPLIAPKDKARLGDLQFDQPNWLSDEDLNRTNSTSAVLESMVTDGWRSVGIPTDRAQRTASAQIAAGLGGAAIGAAAVGIPVTIVAAGIGCGAGALIGAGVGASITGGFGAPVSAAIGCGIGAGVGAFGVGLPAAALGAAGGAALGVAGVTPFAAGDLGEPIGIDVSNIDQAAITAQTEQVKVALSGAPGGEQLVATAEAVVTGTLPIEQQTRDFVASQPGGADVLKTVDTWVETMAPTTPGIATKLTVDAIVAGILPPAQ